MADQNTPPQQPQSYPPPPYYYPPPPYGAPPQYPQPPEAKLGYKGKIIVGIGLLVLLFFGIFSTAHQPASIVSKSQQPIVLPANPQSIESEKLQAERDLAEAKRRAEAAKARADSAAGPTMPHPGQTGQTGQIAQQDPDAQFWHQVRLENWKRSVEAPYASGVGFVTKRPSSSSAAAPAQEAAPLESAPAQPSVSPYSGLARQTPQQQQSGPIAPGQPETTTLLVAPRQEGAPPQSPTAYDFNNAEGPLHRLLEGTIIESTLENQLNGEFVGPVICQLSENVWDQGGMNLLIPAGSKAIGLAQSVGSTNQRRLAVAFHRIEMKDGYSLNLDKFQGLDQIGETGIVSKVNSHYLQIFGASLAVGAVGGLSEAFQTGSAYSPLSGFRSGLTQQSAESAMRVLDRFLNRLPTVIVYPGSRVKIILTTDLPGVPEYAHHKMDPNL